MSIGSLVSTRGKGNAKRVTLILGLTMLAFLLVSAGSTACKKEEGEEVVTQEEGAKIKEEGIIAFEGSVKVAVGKYFFVPETHGFDMIVQDEIDASAWIGKEVRGEGQFFPERPSVLIANSIDVKEESGDWMNVFTRTGEIVLDDYLDLKTREEFHVLKDLAYDKKQGWEEIERAKVYGKLEKDTVTEGGEQKDVYKVIVLGEKDREIGKIIIDSLTDFSQYYITKLRLFDKFWFYVTIKDTVDWSVRRRTRELFHADLLCAGLF
ncbi:MAG: hypothetical protein JSV96_10280 [Candidatus Aminicenantes bacterium]|nr:MAG: hypothetical protein JSV96_10280 [Candidatus Aminicenantes bacterium]